MIIGDIRSINLSTSSFERMIAEGSLYIDKTRMIENFLQSKSDVHLLARQRRLGKSLNMDMLRCFLTDREDLRHLFIGLYIERSPQWNKANSAPVFYFDFKGLQPESYKDQVIKQIDKHIYSLVNPDSLSGYLKKQYDKIICGADRATESLYFLTELTYELTGKRSYLLIDEYDKLLLESYNTEIYDEVRLFETALLSSALKGNQYLEKALLTGVMRISHESMFSGLNNIVTFDVFSDSMYTDNYGLTDGEMECLSELAGFDINETRTWYNGIRIGGHAIYNIYSVMSYMTMGKYDCYWGKTGTMDMIIHMLNDSRKAVIAKLLNSEKVDVDMDNRISLRRLSDNSDDQAFYSMLVQAGYLALEDAVLSRADNATVSIPNTELMIVWRKFIFNSLYSSTPKIKTLFDNANDLSLFSKDVEYFLRDRLSYHDLSAYKNDDDHIHERMYHVFMLGILCAYEDTRFKYPLSNRESGSGRYDVLVEKPAGNFIFEFKVAESEKKLDERAQEALAQIETKRYGMDLSTSKRLVRVGVAFYGKMCIVRCSEV